MNPNNYIGNASLFKFQRANESNYFEVEIWHRQINGATINLLVGANPIAAAVLNDKDVYGLLDIKCQIRFIFTSHAGIYAISVLRKIEH